MAAIKPGAGVVTTRGHVEYVVTEYGVVNLSAQSLSRRAELLISIAHPDCRAIWWQRRRNDDYPGDYQLTRHFATFLQQICVRCYASTTR